MGTTHELAGFATSPNGSFSFPLDCLTKRFSKQFWPQTLNHMLGHVFKKGTFIRTRNVPSPFVKGFTDHAGRKWQPAYRVFRYRPGVASSSTRPLLFRIVSTGLSCEPFNQRSIGCHDTLYVVPGWWQTAV